VDKNMCGMMFYTMFEHACEHFSVSVNAVLFQMLISQSD